MDLDELARVDAISCFLLRMRRPREMDCESPYIRARELVLEADLAAVPTYMHTH